MTTLFSDDFNGAAGAPPDPTKWWATPWCSTSPDDKEGCYNTANAHLDGHGHLVLRASNGTMGRPYDFGRVQTFVEGSWPPKKVLAKITPPFRIEASIKFAPGPGVWGAFWMNGVMSSKPVEIDVQEFRGATPFQMAMHLHKTQEWAANYASPADLSGGFHTYAVEVKQGHGWQLTCYLDGKVAATVPLLSASVQPVGIRLTNQIGVPGTWGGRGGPPPPADLPADMLVDYVHASSL